MIRMELSFCEALFDNRTFHPVIVLEQPFQYVSVFFSLVSMHFISSCTIMCVLLFVVRQPGMSVMQRDAEVCSMGVHERNTIHEGA
jgi:hypothetical protein